MTYPFALHDQRSKTSFAFCVNWTRIWGREAPCHNFWLIQNCNKERAQETKSQVPPYNSSLYSCVPASPTPYSPWANYCTYTPHTCFQCMTIDWVHVYSTGSPVGVRWGIDWLCQDTKQGLVIPNSQVECVQCCVDHTHLVPVTTEKEREECN